MFSNALGPERDNHTDWWRQAKASTVNAWLLFSLLLDTSIEAIITPITKDTLRCLSELRGWGSGSGIKCDFFFLCKSESIFVFVCVCLCLSVWVNRFVWMKMSSVLMFTCLIACNRSQLILMILFPPAPVCILSFQDCVCICAHHLSIKLQLLTDWN